MNVSDGKVLRIDLSEKAIASENFDKYREWIGGQGVNQYILFNELPVGISPYNPSNLIVVGTGLLVGTSAPGACRTNIDTLNAFTGGIGSSNAGGNFANELRSAGVNNIVLKGKAPTLVYVLINDNHAEVVDASHLKQKTVTETANLLTKELGHGYKFLIIGPAGENLVRSACVIVDGARAAGRCGIGAVMGSKNIKAIAVKGTGMVEPTDPVKFDNAVKHCLAKINSSSFAKAVKHFGIYRQEPWEIESPYRNFSGEIPESEKKRKIMPENFLPYMVETKTCVGCPLHCWKVYQFTLGNEVHVSEALQINSIHNFGARLDLFDPRSILKAHALCNDLGLDEDNASASLAWAFECYEKGILTKEDTEGIDLQWGNTELVFDLLRKTAYRRGFGDILAEGCWRASDKFPGSRESCINVKGQELFEILWACPAWALGTVVAARGGTHTRGAVKTEGLKDIPSSLCQRLFGIPSVGDKLSYDHKERLVVFFERLEALSNSLGICYFMHGLSQVDMLLPEDYARLYSAATGIKTDTARMLWFGERIFNLEKCFNVLHTEWTRKDDMPPMRFVSQPLGGKFRINTESWESMLDRYYELHGWDKATGRPHAQTLQNLNLTPLTRKQET